MKTLFFNKGLTLLIIAMLTLFMLDRSVWADSSTIIKMGKDIVVESGTKVGSVISLGGQITIDGTVDGYAIAIGNSIVLSRDAIVTGNAVSIGGTIVKAKGAQIQGNQTEINTSEAISTALNEEWQGWSWIFAVISAAIFLCILIIAILTVTLLPGPIKAISSFIVGDTLRVSLWGILGLVLVVPLAVLLTISVIGIVLIPLEVIIVTCAALTGFIAMGRLVGSRMYSLLKKAEQGIIRETFWGLIVLWLIGWLPYIGGTVKVLAVVIGMGGVIASRFGTRSYVKQL
jgi:hypothetical protein